MFRKWIFKSFIGLLAFASFSALADTSHPFKDQQNDRNWFVGIGVGKGRERVSSSAQYVYYTPYSSVDKYTVSQTVNTNLIPSIEGGYRFASSGKLPFIYLIGLRYRSYNANNFNGNILVLNDPAFPYAFSFDVAAQTLSLFGKIDLMSWGHFAPYITAGLGGASLKFTNYNEYPMTDVSVPRDSAAFAANSVYNLTYDLGFGLDYYFSDAWSASLGYDYVNLGKLKTGLGALNNTTGKMSTLNFGTVTANTVFLQTDYFFDV
jgi:opacity protein-like surface antigen